MIHYAKLDIAIDISSIQQEVTYLNNGWLPHFNNFHYEGSWNILPLHSPSGHIDQIIPDLLKAGEYKDTILLNVCPHIEKILSSFQCEKMSVRLMNLKSGSFIKEHSDPELSFENGEARIHIPVFTNQGVEFYSNNELLKMTEGECWYVNVNLPHRVYNGGADDRIHLVIDLKVNAWLEDLFRKSQCTYVRKELADPHTKNIIRELRMQNTETANKLADHLERSLAPKN